MEKSRVRREKGLFVIEGIRELEIALKSGYIIQELYLCPAILQDGKGVLVQGAFPDIR